MNKEIKDLKESIKQFEKDCLSKSYFGDNKKTVEAILQKTKIFIDNVNQRKLLKAQKNMSEISYILTDTLTDLPKSVWDLEKKISLCYESTKRTLEKNMNPINSFRQPIVDKSNSNGMKM